MLRSWQSTESRVRAGAWGQRANHATLSVLAETPEGTPPLGQLLVALRRVRHLGSLLTRVTATRGRLRRALAFAPLSLRDNLVLAFLGLTLLALATAWLGLSLMGELQMRALALPVQADTERLGELPAAVGLTDGAVTTAERGEAAILEAVERADSGMFSLAGVSREVKLGAIVLLLVLVATLIVVGAQAMADAITAPLRAAGTQLGRIAGGDFSARLTVTNDDEIGRLSSELNRATDELARLYAVERERRAEAEALAQREHELAASKEFWAHTIVHDLRGPLTVVAGFAELLDDERLGPLSAGQRNAVMNILRASSQVLVEVQDILDLFRMEQSALALNLQPLAVAELFAHVA